MLKYAETTSILNYFQCLLFYNQKCARFIDIGLFTGHKLDLCDFCGESSRQFSIFIFQFSLLCCASMAQAMGENNFRVCKEVQQG